MTELLDIQNLNGWYGDAHVLQGVTFQMAEGRVTGLLGRNGAGKTTLMRAVMGVLARREGRVLLDGKRIDRMASHRVARAGLGYVPESRGIFPSLSVRENLTVASRPARRNLGKPWSLERVFEAFPRLAERRNVGGGQLSGGEQQLLAIARALLGNCRVLLLDEPTEGLAPTVVSDIERLLMSLKASGATILLVEQNYPVALRLADNVLVLGKGRLQWSGAIDEFETAHEVRRTWLGV
jgi:branched-chain amino acid transport system ATP-binding protein